MTSFVESCVETAIGRAVSVERGSRHRPRARKLLNILKGKKNVLITTHQQPDPDALASSLALRVLLKAKLKDAKVSLSVKGNIGGGYNRAFAQQLSGLELVPWDDAKLDQYDAIILLDVQPLMRSSPLPLNIQPTAVIDHHRSGPMRDNGAHEFRDREHRALDMEMSVDQARREKCAVEIDRLLTFVLAEPDDAPIVDRDIR